MKILLVSTYELGRQPFGLASPAAWLRADGHEVTCADLAAGPLPVSAARQAQLVAFHLPMHTATRLAERAIARVRRLNAEAHLCCYGLYAPLNDKYLRKLGVRTVIGGEFEPALRRLAGGEDLGSKPVVSFDRLQFLRPDRAGLPGLASYAALQVEGESRLAGYTEASRGCKHLCRHCPVVPIYEGRFRVVQPEIVLADIRQQVEAGARHITFGDPDFLNGPAHAVRLVEALHEEFPEVTYDVTIKIEHLLKHGETLEVLKRTGCLFVTSAVESIEDHVLEKLDKGHTSADFVEVVRRFREIGLTLAPTFIPFTPWTSRAGYQELLRLLVELELVESVAPVQLALRLLIPAGSRLLELPDVVELLDGFDEAALIYRWKHPDQSLDALAARLLALAGEAHKMGLSRRETFQQFWELAHEGGASRLPDDFRLLPRAAVPYLNEPWYC